MLCFLVDHCYPSLHSSTFTACSVLPRLTGTRATLVPRYTAVSIRVICRAASVHSTENLLDGWKPGEIGKMTEIMRPTRTSCH